IYNYKSTFNSMSYINFEPFKIKDRIISNSPITFILDNYQVEYEKNVCVKYPSMPNLVTKNNFTINDIYSLLYQYTKQYFNLNHVEYKGLTYVQFERFELNEDYSFNVIWKSFF